jgi:signal transduction histidine kinase
MGKSDKQKVELDDAQTLGELLNDEVQSALEEGGGQVVGVTLESGMDLAEATAAIREARESCAKKQASLHRRASLGDVVAGITHQSRNIMTGVLSFSQIARHKNEEPELERLLQNIETESNRCVELMNQILTLARARESSTNGSYEQFSLAEIMDSACRLSEPKIREGDVRLENLVSDSSLKVMGNKLALRGVFVNLLRNAGDATPSGGLIRMSTTSDDDFIVVHCDDSGPGVLPEHRSSVFEASYTTKAPGQGTGLGLAVTRQVVLEHSGDVAVEESSLGGARFVVRLPKPSGKEEAR